MHERWRIELLGGLRAVYRDQVITRFRTQKTASLLAYLAFYRDQQHACEVLVDLLWPEASLPEGRQSLRTALNSLRRQLEPPHIPWGSVLLTLLTPRQTSRATVGLNSLMVSMDVAEFEAAIHTVRQGETQDRIDQLKKVVGLYTSGLLPGFYAEWIQVEQR